MVDGKQDVEKTTSKAGALQSSLSMLLHTHYAIRLWEGRKRGAQRDDGSKSFRYDIISMPQVIARAGAASRDSAADNPYADMLLLKLEEAIRAASEKVQEYVSYLEKTLSGVPKGVTLSDVESAQPLNISVYSRSPLGYRCIWLLIGYDQLAMKAFQAFHYGLISRSQRDTFLNGGGHAIRQVYGVIQPYRTFAVNRSDIENLTASGNEAIQRYGAPDPDVMTGKKRSSFSPPVRSVVAGGKR